MSTAAQQQFKARLDALKAEVEERAGLVHKSGDDMPEGTPATRSAEAKARQSIRAMRTMGKTAAECDQMEREAIREIRQAHLQRVQAMSKVSDALRWQRSA